MPTTLKHRHSTHLLIVSDGLGWSLITIMIWMAILNSHLVPPPRLLHFLRLVITWWRAVLLLFILLLFLFTVRRWRTPSLLLIFIGPLELGGIPSNIHHEFRAAETASAHAKEYRNYSNWFPCKTFRRRWQYIRYILPNGFAKTYTLWLIHSRLVSCTVRWSQWIWAVKAFVVCCSLVDFSLSLFFCFGLGFPYVCEKADEANNQEECSQAI